MGCVECPLSACRLGLGGTYAAVSVRYLEITVHVPWQCLKFPLLTPLNRVILEGSVRCNFLPHFYPSESVGVE